MHLGLTYQLIRLIADLALVRTLSDAQIRAEVLAPRHQLRVFERRVGKARLAAWLPPLARGPQQAVAMLRLVANTCMWP